MKGWHWLRRRLVVRVLSVLWLSCVPAGPAIGGAAAEDFQPGERAEPAITPRGITRAIERGLRADPAIAAHLIDVTFQEGIVTLSGSVDNLLARARAVERAKLIRGVKGVVDRLTVRPVQRPDAELQQNIREALVRDPATDAYEVQVEVRNGVARLTGLVQSRPEKVLAGEVARSIKGVREVENGIAWTPVAERPDAEIRKEVARRLESNVWVDAERLEVAVEAGQVLLSGVVGSAMEKTMAYDAAWVAGAKSVDASQLEVDDRLRERLRRRGAAFPSDADVREAVELALKYDPRVREFKVEVTVEDRVVTLAGVVDNVAARNAAYRDAANVVGVRGVANELRVRPDDIREDVAIAEAVRQALEADPYVDRYDLSVTVYNRRVYLSGDVDSLYERGRAEEVASRVNGVAAVSNSLRTWYGYRPYDRWQTRNNLYQNAVIPPDSPQTLPDDDTIRQRIRDQLFWSPFVDHRRVQVAVEDGVATLQGQVGSARERASAVENAYEAGALLVRDELVIAAGSGR